MDILIQGANTQKHTNIDIAIKNGKIVEVGKALKGTATNIIKASGKFVSAPFVDAHFHLEAVWSKLENASGTLREGVDLWLAYKKSTLTEEDIYKRANQYCAHAFAMGIQAIRSHVDICEPNLYAARALSQLKKDWKDRMEIQLVSFPQDGYLNDEVTPKLLKEAHKIADIEVVGGAPHFERTMAQGAESVHQLCKFAADKGLMVDMHCDETDDPLSRHVETLTACTHEFGLQGRVVASHVTSMAMMDPYYVSRKLIPLMAASDIHVITNPLINVHLGGHFHHPKPRGYAPIKPLMEAGINVSCAQDCNMDPWYPLGNADMTEVARMGAHLGHMMGTEQLNQMFETVTTNPAQAMGLKGYGIEKGCAANLIIFNAPNAFEVMRTSAARETLIRAGKIY